MNQIFASKIGLSNLRKEHLRLAETSNRIPTIVEKLSGLTADFVFHPVTFPLDENYLGMV